MFVFGDVKLSIVGIKVVSSAQLTISNLFVQFYISFIHMLKSKGPNTEPCGIPIFIDVVVDIVELI